jgi:uncharacterized protein YprB with RNaseH-like and TPR domain
MRIYNYEYNDIQAGYYDRFFIDNDLSHYLYFDIETTGLSARNSTLYLIGALWFDNDTIHIRQWFNEDGYSEKELITAFDEFCISFSHLIHFNGTTFDIPYIHEKAAKHSISTQNLDSLNGIDVFKDIRAYKKYLMLDNMKLVTIERFLNVERKDTMTGGDLINVYQRYVARPDDEKEHLLLLHNHDDILGLPNVCNILSFRALLEKPDIRINNLFHDTNEKKLVIEFELLDKCRLPKRLSYTDKNGININACSNAGTVIIPVKSGVMKHFFKDYRNYYYLPLEDMAVHKSVSNYVDSDNRIKANKENCYVKKEDNFIICPDKSYSEAFCEDHNSRIIYRTIDSLINDNEENRIEYTKAIIKQM